MPTWGHRARVEYHQVNAGTLGNAAASILVETQHEETKQYNFFRFVCREYIFSPSSPFE